MPDKRYFVSYFFKKGYGNCDVYIKDGIESFDDIRKIEERIEQKNKIKNVSILFFKEL